MKIPTALVLALLLTACGGGDDKGKADDGGGGEVRAEAMASDLGCSEFGLASTEELGVREKGTCELSGQKVSLYTFATNEARDTWVKIASGFGGRYVVKDRQVFSSDDSATVDAIKDKVGGEIK